MNNFITPGINPTVQRQLQKSAQENAKIREATIDSYASNTARFIYDSIIEFWTSIGDNYEVGMQLTSLGQGLQVYLNSLDYFEPHLIIFNSEFPDGTKMRIVQHITQLNYALIALPKKNQDEPRREIGFCR